MYHAQKPIVVKTLVVQRSRLVTVLIHHFLPNIAPNTHPYDIVPFFCYTRLLSVVRDR